MVKFGSKRNTGLCCAARSVVRREVIPKLGRKLTSLLDCTKVFSWRNIIAFTVLFYVSVDTIFVVGARHPVWNRRVWYCFFVFVFDQFERGRVP